MLQTNIGWSQQLQYCIASYSAAAFMYVRLCAAAFVFCQKCWSAKSRRRMRCGHDVLKPWKLTTDHNNPHPLSDEHHVLHLHGMLPNDCTQECNHRPQAASQTSHSRHIIQISMVPTQLELYIAGRCVGMLDTWNFEYVHVLRHLRSCDVSTSPHSLAGLCL